MENIKTEKQIPMFEKLLIRANDVVVGQARSKKELHSYTISNIDSSSKELFKSDPLYVSSEQAKLYERKEVRKIKEMSKTEF